MCILTPHLAITNYPNHFPTSCWTKTTLYIFSALNTFLLAGSATASRGIQKPQGRGWQILLKTVHSNTYTCTCSCFDHDPSVHSQRFTLFMST